MTKRETILAAFKTALNPTAGVSGRVYRSRVEAFNRAEHPAIVIEPVVDTHSRTSIDRLTNELTVQVVVLVRADIPDTSGDSVVESVHNLIMTNATLDAMLVDLLPISTEFQFVEADKPLGVISLQYKAVYQSGFTDLSSL
jgi:hypothetical protein